MHKVIQVFSQYISFLHLFFEELIELSKTCIDINENKKTKHFGVLFCFPVTWMKTKFSKNWRLRAMQQSCMVGVSNREFLGGCITFF